MNVTEPIDVVTSPGWSVAEAVVSVIVATHERVGFLTELFDAVAAQVEVPVELVIADDGSGPDAVRRLTDLVQSASLPVCALLLPHHGGPAIPRNTAARHGRGAVLAMTDDDCLPQPGWAAAIADALDDPTVSVVQGRTRPETAGWAGPWQRTLDVDSLSGLFELANLGCRRRDLVAVGGVPTWRLLSGRAFGEDAAFGHTLAGLGRAVFRPDAVVEHRMMPGSYRDYLNERVRAASFNELADAVPAVKDNFVLGVFLSDKTVITDLGVAATVTAIASRRALPMLATVPWLRRAWGDAAGRPGRPRVVRTVQVMVADLVGLGALAAASLRARRLLI